MIGRRAWIVLPRRNAGTFGGSPRRTPASTTPRRRHRSRRRSTAWRTWRDDSVRSDGRGPDARPITATSTRTSPVSQGCGPSTHRIALAETGMTPLMGTGRSTCGGRTQRLVRGDGGEGGGLGRQPSPETAPCYPAAIAPLRRSRTDDRRIIDISMKTRGASAIWTRPAAIVDDRGRMGSGAPFGGRGGVAHRGCAGQAPFTQPETAPCTFNG